MNCLACWQKDKRNQIAHFVIEGTSLCSDCYEKYYGEKNLNV